MTSSRAQVLSICVNHVDSHYLMQNKAMHQLCNLNMGAGKRRQSHITVFQETERQNADVEKTGDKASLFARSQRDVPQTMVSPSIATVQLAWHFISQIQ